MTQSAEKTELFETMPIPRAVAKLVIPCVVGSLVSVLYNLVDTFFVGQLNDPVQNAAVTLVAPIMLAFIAINNLFGVGSSSLMSRSMGQKDYDTVRGASVFGFWMAAFFGVCISVGCTIFRSGLLHGLGADESTFLAASGYMFWTVTLGCAPSILNMVLSYLVRSEGSAAAASIGTMSGCITNIILDPIFIMPWGLGMGARGAGMATCIANTVACLYYFMYIARHRGRTVVNINPRFFRFDKKIAGGIFAVGIPAAIQNLLNVVGVSVFTNFVSAYGADALAAMGIAQKINQIPMQITMGSSAGVMPLFSYNYTSGNHKRMRDSFYFTFAVLFAASVLMSGCCFIFAGPIVHVFIDTAAVVEYGRVFLRGYSLALPFLITDFMGVGLYQALGKGTFALVFAICRKLVLEIPAIIILNHIKPPYSLAYAQLCAEFVLAIASVVVVARILTGRTKGGLAAAEGKNEKL